MRMHNLLLTLGGHHAASLVDYPRQQVQPILVAGSLVLLAALVAGGNWALAAFAYTGGQGSVAGLAALVAGMTGALMVCVVDRAMMFGMDALPMNNAAVLPALGLRLFVTIAISGVTATTAASIMMKSEMDAHALHMRENFSATRQRVLAGQLGIAGLVAADGRAEAVQAAAKTDFETVPAPVVKLQQQAVACQRNINAVRRKLIDQGETAQAAANRLAGAVRRCRADAEGARQALQAHVDVTRAALDLAKGKAAEAARALQAARASLADRISEAEGIEKVSVNTLSATVLNSLMQIDSGSWWKYHLLVALLTALELLPLSLKLVSPRSAPGAAIAAAHAISLAQSAHGQATALAAIVDEAADRARISRAISAAFESAALAQASEAEMVASLKLLLPLHAAQKMTEEVERRHVQMEAAAARRPGASAVLTEIWRRAMADTVDNLAAAHAAVKP